MFTMVTRRLLELIPTLIGVTLVTFVLLRLTGDPASLMAGPDASQEVIDQIREDLGLNRPLPMQYLYYMRDLVQGDLGRSITNDRPVTAEIGDRIGASFELALFAMTFAISIGLIVGVLSAIYPRTLLDSSIRFFVFVFLAMPSFWLGLELIIVMSRWLQLFPPAGRGQPWTPSMFGHVTLPAITLGVSIGAFLCRILRSSMLQVLGQDYVRTARAKGLDEKKVILKHALKNAMIPFVTVAGLATGALLGGSVIVEQVFNWPGIGKLLIESIHERNLPVTMGCVLVFATVFVLVNLLVDLTYGLLDPRIRYDSANT